MKENAQFQLPKGFKIGHAQNDYTGVTVILPDGDCVCGVDVRGGAPGTRETDLLKSEKTVSKVNAVALCGGSAFGLEASCGVMDYLLKKKIGFKALDKLVPIVPSAVIFDLNHGYYFPDKAMGYTACTVATDKPQTGRVGAGTGATVGKIRGLKNVSSGGVGIATVNAFGINVTAVVVVNAFGDVWDYKTNSIVAGAKKGDGFANTYNSMLSGSIFKLLSGVGEDKSNQDLADKGANFGGANFGGANFDGANSDGDSFADMGDSGDGEFDSADENNGDMGGENGGFEGSNTTIGCIITDAKLTKIQANKLASIGHNGLALSIRPVHTDYDGDTLFCVSSNKKRVLNFACLQTAVVEAVAKAVVCAVKN